MKRMNVCFVMLRAVLFAALACSVVVSSGCGHKEQAGEAKAAPAARKIKYHCPMHPAIVSDKPGDCPICFMKLELMDNAEAAPAAKIAGLAQVTITTEMRQKMGLRLAPVENRKLVRSIRTSARITADETKMYVISPRLGGWVEKLHVSAKGQGVKKGEALMTLYSPEFVASEQEFLSALKLYNDSGRDAASSNMLAAVRQRFELWDVSREQVDQLAKTGAIEKYLTLYSPAPGVVLEKNVTAGQKFSAGDSLMVLADISTVWGEADIHESDLPVVAVGAPVRLTLSAGGGRVFEGKVSFISPALNTGSRTARARIEIQNPAGELRLEMYADAAILQELGEKVAVPESAVMRTGERVYAFRDAGEGKLVPVEIKLGPRCDGFFEVLSGLASGDKVVSSANFLVDSESSMQAAIGALGEGK